MISILKAERRKVSKTGFIFIENNAEMGGSAEKKLKLICFSNNTFSI